MTVGRQPLVLTIPDRCKTCYGCVRECPAKAIRIVSGQAQVIPDRCIGCGNCVQVCSQGAKAIRDGLPEVEALLASGRPVALELAPSFPAEFVDLPWRRLVGMIRAAGFAFVHEVAFGADLVSERYRRLVEQSDGRQYIATTCPALVEYVQHYFPHLVDRLAPIVSPMVATARVIRLEHGPEVPVVFAGPCIAKKGEATWDGGGEIDGVLTFPELRALLLRRGVEADLAGDSDFDPPHGGLGGLFPVTGGLLKSASIDDDLVHAEGVAVDGHRRFVEAIREFEAGAVPAVLLEVLACEGCVMGPGMTRKDPRFRRQAEVTRTLRERARELDEEPWEQAMERYRTLDLSRRFSAVDRRVPGPSPEELQELLARLGKSRPEDELNCGACGYATCVEHATAIHQGLAENEMCLPYAIDRLRTTVRDLHASHEQLAAAQEALVQAEKLASMGQLAAGIAHEVNNPLGVVLMYAHLLAEELPPDSPLAADLRLIAEQATRCKNIVSGLLNFARQNQVRLQPVDVRDLVQAALRGVRRSDSVKVVVEDGACDPMAELDRDQVIQVLVNVLVNACEAMPQGGTLTVRIDGDADWVVLEVEDTGVGIPQDHMGRIFTPFFTTKPMGRGTGLGLAVSYGIVKMHRGEIRVRSQADPTRGPTGTTFTIRLPRRGRSE
ncbi:MAG TPA: [Fe-Fe] hydrogenase large subunit C-terminal domain-containing protein [Myxococcota bacterium]|nr:[Fe-Fe] hydrogenase large subunit C-terminal domain-containing protein [Myxococcota bacterium]HQK50673.1 [Fe-Fe] hydrogenase large subunit C-terminal domain-containing protein [Myxococcota bacterium]